MNDQKSGFAIVIVLILVGFVLLITLTLSLEITTSSKEIGARVNGQLARQYAKFSTKVAQGQIAKYLGPDLRISARSDIYSGGNESHYTAVWGSFGDEDNSLENLNAYTQVNLNFNQKPVVLVSGNERFNFSLGENEYPGGYVSDQVSPGQAGNVIVRKNGTTEVAVPLVNIVNQIDSRFAYWVTDEGIKANLLPNESELDEANPISWMGIQEAKLRIEDQLFSASSNSFTLQQLSAEIPKLPSDVASNFTLSSNGILTNPRTGGLRKDINEILTSSNDKVLNELIFPKGNDGDDINPSWRKLKNFVNNNGVSEPVAVRPAIEGNSGFTPVPIRLQLGIVPTYVPWVNGTEHRVRIHLQPLIALWNPYNKDMIIENPITVFYRPQSFTNFGISIKTLRANGTNFDTGNYDLRTLKFRIPASTVIPKGEAKYFSPPEGKQMLMTGNNADLNTLVEGFNPNGSFYMDTDDFTDKNGNRNNYIDTQRKSKATPVKPRVIAESPLDTCVLVYRAKDKNAAYPPIRTYDTFRSFTTHWTFQDANTDNLLFATTFLNNGRSFSDELDIVYESDPSLPGSTALPVESIDEDAIEPTSSSFVVLPTPKLLVSHLARFSDNQSLNVANVIDFYGSSIKPFQSFNARANYSMSLMKNSSNQRYGFSGNPFYVGLLQINEEAVNAFDNIQETLSGGAPIPLPGNDLNERLILYEIFEENDVVIPTGITQFQQANLQDISIDKFSREADGEYDTTKRGGSIEMPHLPLGNSFANHRIGKNSVFADQYYNTNRYDWSFLLNKSLYDDYFVNPKENGTPQNPRYGEKDGDLFVKGMFNVNSTSREAWAAILYGAYQKQVNGALFAGEAPFPRMVYPNNDALSANAALTLSQINELAESIVREVKRLGPFPSISSFVNRSTNLQSFFNKTGSNKDALRGVLQLSIDNTNINGQLVDEYPSKNDPDAGEYPYWDSANGSFAEGLNQYFTQADLLRQIDSFIHVRSDTFTIRACGVYKNQIIYCDVVLQRTHDFYDNPKFGRKFKVVSVQWLNQDEI